MVLNYYMEHHKKDFNDYSVGDEASFEEMVTADMINEFGRLSGDKNPVHFDARFASQTQLVNPIAHGMIAGMMFSRLLGMHMPGPGALYLSQKMLFHRPIYPNTAIIVNGMVMHNINALGVMTMRTTVRNKETNELLVDGEAVVKMI